jgi:multidrug efflux system membrane fusion protein
LIKKHDEKLIEAGVISREEYENAVAKANSDDATVRADQSAVANLQAAVDAEKANVKNARLQLAYANITSPIDGKTGSLAVTVGNLVRANDTTALITITQTKPIYVTFSVPEQDLPQIRQKQGSKDFRVEVIVPGDESNPAQGSLSLVDNAVDTTTGTIKLKATILNGDGRLFPGQFVNVVLTLGQQTGATVVPSQAVQVGQDTAFVYVVKPDMTVEVRNVKPGSVIDNLTVIDEGLKTGEHVVTDGQLRLVPGSKVQAKSPQGQGKGNAGGGGGGGKSGGSSAGAGGAAPANPYGGTSASPSGANNGAASPAANPGGDPKGAGGGGAAPGSPSSGSPGGSGAAPSGSGTAGGSGH